jgi:hypothetical protein
MGTSSNALRKNLRCKACGHRLERLLCPQHRTFRTVGAKTGSAPYETFALLTRTGRMAITRPSATTVTAEITMAKASAAMGPEKITERVLS